MRLVLGLIVGLLLATPCWALDRAALASALASGDTEAMVAAVADIYEDAGASAYDTLTWRFEPYDYTFNYFDPYEDVIVLGSMPDATQVADYWANWSRTLTGGLWQAGTYFSGPEQARDLARFNAFVIALHEMGHAQTYRYDYGHVERHDYAVNCREYYADRLAVAALGDLADEDPAIAGLWRDYVALMASMNAAIAEKDRYHIESFAALDANCAVIEVAQPTPETLQPYASAYFERQRLLAAADLPSLKQMVATHLEPRRAEFMAEMPYLADRSDYALATRETLEGTHAAGPYERGPTAFTPGFDLGGRLYLARLDYDGDTRRMTLGYGPGGALELVVDGAVYEPDADDVRLVDMVPRGPDDVLLLVAEANGARDSFALYRATQSAGVWSLALMDRLADMAQARLLRAPDGWHYLLASADGQQFGFNPGWLAVQFDLEGNVSAGPSWDGIYGVPIAIEADGDLVTYGLDLMFRFDTKTRFDVIAGNHLEGLKDSTRPEATELVDVGFGQLLPDGRLLFVDTGIDGSSLVIRELRFGGPAG